MKNIIKQIIVVALIAMLILTDKSMVYAGFAREEVEGTAGNTRLTVEAGFSEKNAYTTLTAYDYVDVELEFSVTYENGSRGREVIVRTWAQTTYCEASYNAPTDVDMAVAVYDVCGEDGDWSNTLYAD